MNGRWIKDTTFPPAVSGQCLCPVKDWGHVWARAFISLHQNDNKAVITAIETNANVSRSYLLSGLGDLRPAWLGEEQRNVVTMVLW